MWSTTWTKFISWYIILLIYCWTWFSRILIQILAYIKYVSITSLLCDILVYCFCFGLFEQFSGSLRIFTSWLFTANQASGFMQGLEEMLLLRPCDARDSLVTPMVKGVHRFHLSVSGWPCVRNQTQIGLLYSLGTSFSGLASGQCWPH